jgi:hypothetical protein
MKKQQTLITPENLCTKRSDIDNVCVKFMKRGFTKIALEVRALDRNASETIKMK